MSVGRDLPVGKAMPMYSSRTGFDRWGRSWRLLSRLSGWTACGSLSASYVQAHSASRPASDTKVLADNDPSVGTGPPLVSRPGSTARFRQRSSPALAGRRSAALSGSSVTRGHPAPCGPQRPPAKMTRRIPARTFRAGHQRCSLAARWLAWGRRQIPRRANAAPWTQRRRSTTGRVG